MAPPPPSARGWDTRPAARRPPATPAPCPGPVPATGAGPHPDRRTAPSARSDRSGPAHPAAAAHVRPPPHHPRRRHRTRSPRSPPAYRHPAAHAITSNCARRFLALRFLTYDKPETLSDNDVRPFSTCYTPMEASEEPENQVNAGGFRHGANLCRERRGETSPCVRPHRHNEGREPFEATRAQTLAVYLIAGEWVLNPDHRTHRAATRSRRHRRRGSARGPAAHPGASRRSATRAGHRRHRRSRHRRAASVT